MAIIGSAFADLRGPNSACVQPYFFLVYIGPVIDPSQWHVAAVGVRQDHALMLSLILERRLQKRASAWPLTQTMPLPQPLISKKVSATAATLSAPR